MNITLSGNMNICSYEHPREFFNLDSNETESGSTGSEDRLLKESIIEDLSKYKNNVIKVPRINLIEANGTKCMK